MKLSASDGALNIPECFAEIIGEGAIQLRPLDYIANAGITI
jgi:hypothetical protein